MSGVTLRPLAAEDIPLLDRWRNDPGFQSEYGDFLAMHRRQTQALERWQVNGLLGEDQGMLLICLDDEPVGALQYHQVLYGPNQGSRALNIGVSVEPALRGRGIATQAQRLITEYLFAHTLAHRIEAITDVTNVAEQKALERAGWTREGVLRGAQFRLGEWHDMIVYSRLRTDV
jgi:RimJ/RimL family protein N-acetyltransferase